MLFMLMIFLLVIHYYHQPTIDCTRALATVSVLFDRCKELKEAKWLLLLEAWWMQRP